MLGRDVLSRVLDGGWVLLAWRPRRRRSVWRIGAPAASPPPTSGAGGTDHHAHRRRDPGLPPVGVRVAAGVDLGPTVWLTVLAVGISHAPQVARVMRSAALDVSERDFVKAIELLGVKRRKIMAKEILPNLISPLMVEIGLRLTYSIVIIAGLSFLGFGQPPPAPNWGIMINENRIGLVLNPWAVIVPAALIALLTIGINTLTDAVARVAIGIDREAEAVTATEALVSTDVTGERERQPGAPATTSRWSALTSRLRGREHRVVDECPFRSLRGAHGARGRVRFGEDHGGPRPARPHPPWSRRSAAGTGAGRGQPHGDGLDSSSGGCAAHEVAYVPQDPASALNPALRIGPS